MLFSSRSGNAELFQNWATELLDKNNCVKTTNNNSLVNKKSESIKSELFPTYEIPNLQSVVNSNENVSERKIYFECFTVLSKKSSKQSSRTYLYLTWHRNWNGMKGYNIREYQMH